MNKNVLISGAGGFVGSALIPFLKEKGYAITALSRSAQPKGGALRDIPVIPWSVDSTNFLPNSPNFDAVIHLAGESVVGGLWTKERKHRIRHSRVVGTKNLCLNLASLKSPPKVLIAASAIGYYGDRGEEALDESSAKGTGFLADVCEEWEAAAEPAKSAGIRVVHIRIGLVLGRAGGILSKILLPFRLGLGGRLGDGKQFMSWIAIEDVITALYFCLTNESVIGIVNGVAPTPVSNAEFTKTLGKVIHRPTIFPVPAFLLRLVCGELANEALLAGQRVLPLRLQKEGFSFAFPRLKEALTHCTSTNPA